MSAPTNSLSLVTVFTQTPTTIPTIPSPTCPADDGSTYVATNKPQVTSYKAISNTSLSFKILCYTNLNKPAYDFQVFSNVSSLSDCLNICALYNFNAVWWNFPEYACTGVAFGTGGNLPTQDLWHTCWLKGNISLDSENITDTHPGFDGAKLLGV